MTSGDGAKVADRHALTSWRRGGNRVNIITALSPEIAAHKDCGVFVIHQVYKQREIRSQIRFNCGRLQLTMMQILIIPLVVDVFA